MKLINNQLEVHFTTLGGEMTSIKNRKNGIEYLWQGDAMFWKGKNPTLFPIVGNTYDGTYEVDGITYRMNNHGLIRSAELTCSKQNDDSITFTLSSNKTTMQQYPFQFNYKITYTLKQNSIEIVYTITNLDSKVMPFNFGLHPGFNCPLASGERFEDYRIEFECEEHLQQLRFDPNKVKPHTYTPVTMKEWQLNYDDLEKYSTLIYKGMSSSYVTLQGPKHGVRVSIAGYPYLALWSVKRGAPFLCIEPWYGHGDFEKNDATFSERIGTMKLAPTKSFITSYSIEIL